MILTSLIHSVHCSPENLPLITEKVIKQKLSKEDGWDRIKRMYSIDEFGFSPEMKYVITTGQCAISFAALFGGVGSALQAKNEFFRKNKAAKFDSQHLARKNLTETMTAALIKGGFTSAFKYGSFTCFYFLSTMSIANYRNKMSVWEHAASGAVLGGFSQIKFGLKGFAVAGVLGGILGLVAGGFITTSTGFGGMTMDEFRCWMHEDHYMRLQLDKEKESKKSS